ncbi:MAG: sigma-70 family RNA polymerase sigma factor [Clostridia bacterium]|nr:sigma-70 family RNA polymerase sigma factor [Clostridia bacterium]
MQDSQIIELYFARDEQAISATSAKYNSYCMQIAMNILHNNEDSEECVNDTYLAAWNSIPPNRPERLSAYLGRLTRNLSLNRYKSQHASRRGGGEFALSLDELDDCVADTVSPEQDAEALGAIISEFLYTQSKETRQVFVRRYFYSDSISDICDRFGMSESRAKSMLHRTRLALRAYLGKHGINI